MLYGLLFYSAPLLGLIGTWAADRSQGRVFFSFACCSTALLCPLIFGFPTEMWLAHALFWPALAVSHSRRTGFGAVAHTARVQPGETVIVSPPAPLVDGAEVRATGGRQ